MNKETIKDCLLCYLNEYSKRNEVRIENVNPFSVEIAKNVEQNVIVEIISIDKRNKEMNIKNNNNIDTVYIFPYIKDDEWDILINEILPIKVKKLVFIQYLDTNLNIKDKFKDYKELEIIEYCRKYNIVIKEKEEKNNEQILNVFSNDFIDNLIDYSMIKQLTITPSKEQKEIVKFPEMKRVESLKIDYCNIILNKECLNNYSFINLKELTLTSISVELLLKAIHSSPSLKNLSFSLLYTECNEDNMKLLSKEINSKTTLKKVAMTLKMIPFNHWEKHDKVSDNTLYSFSITSLVKLSLYLEHNIDLGKVILNNPNITSLYIRTNYIVTCSMDLISNIIPHLTELFLVGHDSDYSPHIYLDDSVVDFILKFVNLEKMYLTGFKSKNIYRLLNSIDTLTYLRSLIFCKHDYAQKTLNYLDKLKKCLLLEELDLNFVWIRNERDVSEFLFPFCNYFPLMYTIGVGYYDFPERKYKNLINAYTLNKKIFLNHSKSCGYGIHSSYWSKKIFLFLPHIQKEKVKEEKKQQYIFK